MRSTSSKLASIQGPQVRQIVRNLRRLARQQIVTVCQSVEDVYAQAPKYHIQASVPRAEIDHQGLLSDTFIKAEAEGFRFVSVAH